MVAGMLSAGCSAAAKGFDTEPVSWTNGEVRLAGTLYRPDGPGAHPAAIFIHGSGNMGRGRERGNDILRAHAEYLAAHGVAVLLYDKRGVGESTGTWRNASFDELAADAAGGLKLLSVDSRIDPARLGIIGLSQGSWISLKTVNLFPTASFLIWVTGPAVSPARQEEQVLAVRLREARVPPDGQTAAKRLLLQALETYRTNSGWDALKLAASSAAKEPWFKPSGLAIAEPAEAWWKWYASFMDYDPRPALEQLKAPLFAAFAGEDQLVDSQESMTVLASLRDAGKNLDIHLYPGLRHGLTNSSRALSIPDSYWRDLSGFLERSGIVPTR